MLLLRTKRISKKLLEAERFAKKKHRHQLRKDKKTPYWFHLRQVVRNLSAIGIADNDILCAGWLHDTIEDTDTDYDNLAEKFGARVARIVVEVTKDKTLPERKKERAFCAKLSNASWEAQAVKLCDIWANLADLRSGYGNRTRRLTQIKKKMKDFYAIRSGLVRHSTNIPNILSAVDSINMMLRSEHVPAIGQAHFIRSKTGYGTRN